MAWLDRDLRHGRLAPAINAVHERLIFELNQYHAVSTEEIYTWFRPYHVSSNPLLLRASRIVRRLDLAYQMADLAEDLRLTDPWSRWRRASRKTRSRAIFAAGMREVQEIWPQLESGR